MEIKPAEALELCRLGNHEMDEQPVYIFEEWLTAEIEEKSGWIIFAFLMLFVLMTAPMFL